jgi:hypothetical protein
MFLLINLGEVEDKRFELSEPSGRVFKVPGTSLRLIKNVLDKVKGDLGNSPYINDPCVGRIPHMGPPCMP